MFNLVRSEDVSGVSGTGTVAEGVQFHDGKVCLSWFGKHHCEAIWDTLEDMLAIHGHEGRTRVVWADESPSSADFVSRTLQTLLDLRREPTRADLRSILEVLDLEREPLPILALGRDCG